MCLEVSRVRELLLQENIHKVITLVHHQSFKFFKSKTLPSKIQLIHKYLGLMRTISTHYQLRNLKDHAALFHNTPNNHQDNS